MLAREHAGIASLAHGEQLVGLLAELPGSRKGTVRRIPVPPGVAGRSLRDADFRRTHAREVIAIQTAAGELIAPPMPRGRWRWTTCSWFWIRAVKRPEPVSARRRRIQRACAREQRIGGRIGRHERRERFVPQGVRETRQGHQMSPGVRAQ